MSNVTLTRRSLPPDPAVACEVVWNRREEVTYWRIPSHDWHRLNPLVPERGEDLMPTHVDARGFIAQDSLMWPTTPAGVMLRELYLEAGERALCSVDSLRNEPWWLDDGVYRCAW